MELEWITVDADRGGQVPAAPALLAALPERLRPRIKAELFASTLEINTSIHQRTDACFAELAELRRWVLAQPQMARVGLLAAGTHPFSHWRAQQVSDDPRYHKLLRRMGWMARRFNIFGMHVHVGTGNGARCIEALNALLPVMHLFLAVSANSPFWHGDDTALASCRIKVFEGLSQGGMPFYFRDWDDFAACVARLEATGSIDSIREIWWEMRPHPDFGTLEVRICDMPATFEDARALVAWIRAEVMTAAAGRRVVDGRVHPSLIRENRWRACRYGLASRVIDPASGAVEPLVDAVAGRLAWLDRCGEAQAEDLELLARALPRWREGEDGARRQRRLLAACDGEMAALVRRMRLEDGWDGEVVVG